jgi:hypothetical protein
MVMGGMGQLADVEMCQENLELLGSFCKLS